MIIDLVSRMLNRIILLILLVSAFVIGCSPALKTYTLDESISQYGFGFSINYPDNWLVQETYPQEDYIQLLLKQESYVIQFIKLNAPNNEADVHVGVSYVKGDESYTLSKMEKTLEKNKLPGQTIVEQKRIRLNNDQEALYTYNTAPSYMHTAGPAKGEVAVPQNIVINMIEKNKVFTLLYSATFSSPEIFEKHKSTAIEIMNSFKFE